MVSLSLVEIEKRPSEEPCIRWAAALRLALKHKGDLQALTVVSEDVSTKQGQSVGALFLLQQLAKQLGITQALGRSREAKLVLWSWAAQKATQRRT